MEIIPAIDLRDGRCVRLRQGDYAAETVFGDEPVAVAQRWVAEGAKRLHIVDLDGARQGRPANLASVRAIIERVGVPCQFGGGVRSTELARELFQAGLDQVVVGTRALGEPNWFRSLCRAYPNRVALGLDARGGNVATHGWLAVSSVPAIDLAKQLDDLPLAAIIYTDIARDGMLEGVNLRGVEEIMRAVRTPVIAAGGVTSLDDVRALKSAGVTGCIVGLALYEGRMSLSEAIRVANEASP